MQPPPLVPSHHWCTYISYDTIGALAHIIVPTPPICTFTTIGAPNHWCTYTHLVTVHQPLVHSSPLVHIRTSLIRAHTHTLVIRLPSLGHPELLVDTDTTLRVTSWSLLFYDYTPQVLKLHEPAYLQLSIYTKMSQE